MALGLAGLLAGFAATLWRELDIFPHLAAHFAGFAIAGALAFWAQRAKMLILLGACACAVLTPPAIARLYRDGGPTMTARASPTPSLKILSHNVLFLNDAQDVIEAAIRRADADIVLLAEFHIDKKPMLDRLSDVYPHHVFCAYDLMDKFNASCDVAILSKRAWVDAGANADDGVRMAYATFDHGGQPLTVIATHLALPGKFTRVMGILTPRPGLSLQREQFAALSQIRNRFSGAVIIGGDFNATPWSPVVSRFKADTGLRRAGAWFPTWPAQPLGLPQFAIDQFFVSPDVRVDSVRLSDAAGSDHYAILGQFRP